MPVRNGMGIPFKLMKRKAGRMREDCQQKLLFKSLMCFQAEKRAYFSLRAFCSSRRESYWNTHAGEFVRPSRISLIGSAVGCTNRYAGKDFFKQGNHTTTKNLHLWGDWNKHTHTCSIYIRSLLSLSISRQIDKIHGILEDRHWYTKNTQFVFELIWVILFNAGVMHQDEN